MHPIENIMQTSMEQIKDMVDVNTIVGTPVITADGTMILPVSKVSLGFMAGGGEYKGGAQTSVKRSGEELDKTEKYPFIGTAVAGLSLTPKAFVSVTQSGVRVMPVECGNVLDRVVDLIPEVITGIKNTLTELCAGRRENAQEGNS